MKKPTNSPKPAKPKPGKRAAPRPPASAPAATPASRLPEALATAPAGTTVLKECRHGRMLYLRRDRYVGRSLDLYGEMSEQEAETFSRMLRPGNVVIEVGANIGAHTVHLAKLVGPGGAVVAYEPQRVIFQLLCANLALNELFNVRTFHAAVGRAAGFLRVPIVDYASERNFGGISLANVPAGEEVRAVTLDAMPLSAVHLIKIDVESMEAEVLSGARATIAKHRPILYVENDRRDKSAELIALIAELGYDMWWHLPAMFNPDNFAKNPVNAFRGLISVNLVCFPKEAATSVLGCRKVSGPGDWWNDPAVAA